MRINETVRIRFKHHTLPVLFGSIVVCLNFPTYFHKGGLLWCQQLLGPFDNSTYDCPHSEAGKSKRGEKTSSILATAAAEHGNLMQCTTSSSSSTE